MKGEREQSGVSERNGYDWARICGGRAEFLFSKI